MRKTVVNRLLSFLMITSMAMACLAGCGEKKTTAGSADFGEVWSAPSTVKVLRDEEYAERGKAELHFNTVRNEQESRQLIITAKKDIKDFDLKVEDLKSDNTVLTKDNIKVYLAKQIPIKEVIYFANETTYIPDALVPIENAREAGDLKTEKGQNVDIWVNVDIPKDAEAGIYTGTFVLDVDGTKMDIPVSVTVNDYTLPDQFSTQTLFSWRYERVAAGELDSSVGMMEYYYQFFLEHGITLQALPMEALTGEELILALDKYYDVISSFCILRELGDIGLNLASNKPKVREQIFALAEASTPERNLFDKAMIYTVDEPYFPNESAVDSVISQFTSVQNILIECADEIEADNTGKYAEFKKIPTWRESVVDIPSIIPMGATSAGWLYDNQDTEKGKELLSLINCICPAFNSHKKGVQEKIFALVEKYDLELWWYGCCDPTAPGPTYHIGDLNLLSSRSISWLQRKYDIQGNLYWDAAAYTTEDKSSYNQYINLYEHPYRISGAPAGDGFLAYPGAAYGIFGPLASTRLMSILDGMEEYEMLKSVETHYDSLKDIYGEKFSTDECMESFYTLLSNGEYYMTADGQRGLDFDALRSELIKSAAAINDDVKFAFGTSKAKDNIVTITSFAVEGTEITVNGEKLTRASDGSYVYALDLMKETTVEIQVAAADGTTYSFNRFIGVPEIKLQTCSDQSVEEKVTVSEGSTVALVNSEEYSTDGTSLKVNVNGVITGKELVDLGFTPSFSINVADFEGIEKLTDLSMLQMDVYNPGETFSMAVRVYSGSAHVEVTTHKLVHGLNGVSVPIDGLNFSKMDEADRIAFEFVNSEDGKTPLNYEFYIDNIVGKN